MSWLLKRSQKTWYFGEDILLLFPQEMRGCGIILTWYGSGLIGEDPPPRNSDYRYKEINLEELQDTWCIFYLLKHKISSLTDLYTMHSLLVLMQIDKLPFKVYIFLNQRDQTSIKTDGPVIQHPEQLQDCCLKRSSLTEYSREDLTIILIFSSFPQDYQGPKTTGSSLENNTHVPKRWVMDIII